ncbi:MAG: primase-helicase family protein [Halioglobus sp.]
METSIDCPSKSPIRNPIPDSTSTEEPKTPLPKTKLQPTTAIQLDPQKLLDPALSIVELNRRYAVVSLGGKAQVAVDHDNGVQFMTFQDFERFYSNILVTVEKRQVQLGKYWLSHPSRRQYLDGVIFDPSLSADTGRYNLWSGYAVAPDPSMSCDQFLHHLLTVICDGSREYYEYFLNWLALLAQHPGSLPLVAIVLLSDQGTGKGLLMEYLGKIFGRHYKHITNRSHLTGAFSGHLQDAVLVFADELSWDGNKADAGIMKGLITEPTRMMEKKFADAVSVKNCTHLITASNEKWAVPAEMSDRRYFVLDVSSSKQGDNEYFSTLVAEMNGGGPSRLLAFLLQRDISNFKASKFPITQARINQQLQSLEPVEQWLVEQLGLGYINCASGTDWPERLDKQPVYGAFCSWFSQRRLKSAMPSLGTFSSTLGRYGISTCRMSTENRPYGYRFPPLEAVRGQFEDILGGKVDMENNDAA